MRVQFKNDGTTNVWDGEHGHVPELERPWLTMFVAFLKSVTIDPAKVEFEMPNGWLKLGLSCVFSPSTPNRFVRLHLCELFLPSLPLTP